MRFDLSRFLAKNIFRLKRGTEKFSSRKENMENRRSFIKKIGTMGGAAVAFPYIARKEGIGAHAVCLIERIG